MVTSTRQLLVETMEIYDEPNKSHNNSDTSLATTEGSRQNSANHSPSTPCNSHSPRLGLKASFSGNNLRAIAGNFVAQSPESGYFSSAPGYPNIFHPIAALRPGVDLSAANNEDSVFGNVVQTSTPTNKMHKPALRPTATPRAALPLLAAPNQKDGVLENVIKTGTRAYKIRKTGLPSRAPRKPELKLLAPINEEDDVFGNVMPTSSLAIKIRKESNRDFQNLFKIDKPSSAKDKDMGL